MSRVRGQILRVSGFVGLHFPAYRPPRQVEVSARTVGPFATRQNLRSHVVHKATAACPLSPEVAHNQRTPCPVDLTCYRLSPSQTAQIMLAVTADGVTLARSRSWLHFTKRATESVIAAPCGHPPSFPLSRSPRQMDAPFRVRVVQGLLLGAPAWPSSQRRSIAVDTWLSEKAQARVGLAPSGTKKPRGPRRRRSSTSCLARAVVAFPRAARPDAVKQGQKSCPLI